MVVPWCPSLGGTAASALTRPGLAQLVQQKARPNQHGAQTDYCDRAKDSQRHQHHPSQHFLGPCRRAKSGRHRGDLVASRGTVFRTTPRGATAWGLTRTFFLILENFLARPTRCGRGVLFLQCDFSPGAPDGTTIFLLRDSSHARPDRAPGIR
jgi:hypothetical protein